MRKLTHANGYDDEALAVLDELVFRIYRLEPHERLIVLNGLDRAKREYKTHKIEAELATTIAQLRPYAREFLSVINAWQTALSRRSYGAEILDLRSGSPLRIIRFFEGGRGEVDEPKPDSGVNEVLARIGARIQLPITERLSAVRELRVHGDGELLIIKPAARRYWTPATGLKRTLIKLSATDCEQGPNDSIRGEMGASARHACSPGQT